MYIGDYLARREIYSPDKLAFIDAGKSPRWRLTYRQANQRANKLANLLASLDVGKGDRVAILARDGVEHIEIFFACSKLGAIHTALNWRLHWQELLDIFRNTAPKALIFSEDFNDSVEQLISEYPIKALHLDTDGVGDSAHYETTWIQMALATALTTRPNCRMRPMIL
jgi:fatty-acyl-CoA synthase